ncbi:hypothetical protein BKA67DRAFT_578440 [Truncatella angustata]|uniref:Protein kinase domain-containing protein n=1 Tax=Truncatella angustata TaxID=152316 RepID=A0A9P8RQR7_9PEZI|nr:uncharacterized protein BKA67DRAFT_578440 [Truncatella angustata]KAH6647742.1 hypothetical protein BKA67DRAFT_578440 [Truncatella angustata]
MKNRCAGHKRGKTPMQQTDLFMWGALVYELMTGFRPGTRPRKSSQEVQAMMTARQWPAFEKELLCEVVRNCWDGSYRDAEAVRANVISFLEGEGWEVEGEDL